MWSTITETLGGFLVYQTPVSFMAGVGVHHLFCKYILKKEGHRVREEE